MRHLDPSARSQIVDLYRVEHLTLAQIAPLFGITRQGIWKILKKAGVSAREGERVAFLCEHCKQPDETTRERWRKSRRHYCSLECYYASLYNPALVLSKVGRTRSRAAVRRHFDLQPQHVVHHHDSDETHDWIENLAVFENFRDHMNYERGGSAKPIWDGAVFVQTLRSQRLKSLRVIS